MIRLDNVCVHYTAATALHPVSTELKGGECTVLLGPSGAGKSTLLRCINLLTRPTSGLIAVEGTGIIKSRRSIEEHRRNTAMIFQRHQLIERQTALQNVLVGRLGYHGTLRSLFPLPKTEQLLGLESLERVGLIHKAMERVDRLSGGERQRVGIARMLVQKPRIMLADEPVASLDPATAHKIMDLLRVICRDDRLTAVVSLHQIELAREYADRIIGLRSGRVVFDGPPSELTDVIVQSIYHDTRMKTSAMDRQTGVEKGFLAEVMGLSQ